MRRSMLVYILLLAVVLGVLYFVGQRIQTTDAAVLVDEVAGTVEIRRHEEVDWQPLVLGEWVTAGDEIRTGADGEVDLRCHDLTHIRLAASASLKLISSKTDNMKRQTGTDTELTKGKGWFRLREGLNETYKFTVNTPAVKTMVRGTIFSVEIRDDGSVEVQTFTGDVGAKQEEFGSMVRDQEFAVYTVEPQVVKPEAMPSEYVLAWKTKSEIVDAFLNVSNPEDGANIAEDIIDVEGYTDPGNLVEINGQRANVDKQGKWALRLALREGENIIVASAVDGEGRRRDISLTVTH